MCGVQCSADKEEREDDEEGGGRRHPYQGVCLANLLGRLLQTALGLVDLAVAAVNVVLHVAQVVKVEPPAALLVGVGVEVLGLEGLVVDLGTGPQLVLCVCEEVVRAVADEVGAADLGVRDAELRCALVGAAHELLAHELLQQPARLCGGHGVSRAAGVVCRGDGGDAVRCGAVRCSTVQCSAVLCCAVQCWRRPRTEIDHAAAQARPARRPIACTSATPTRAALHTPPVPRRRCDAAMLLSAFLFLLLSACTAGVCAAADYHEQLLLRPLPQDTLLASFNFRSNESQAAFAQHNFRYVPRALGQILQHAHTHELHL